MNPGGRGCGKPRSHHCTLAWTTRVKLCLKKKTKNLKISWVWQHVHVVPVTREAEVGESLELSQVCSEVESAVVESAVSYDPATALQSRQQSKTLS